MKRYCLRLVLVLLLTLVGVVVGTGIAIGELYATVGNAAIQNDRRFRVDDWSFTMYETWGGENVTAHYNADRGPRDTVTEITHRHLPDWTRLHRLAPVPEGVDVNAMEYAFGWPFRWLCFGFRMDSEPETYENIRDLSLDATSIDESLDDGWYPRVRWLDFAATFALWMAVWLVVFYAWSAMRAMKRIRRNRCLDCGYDLRAATIDRCSECGTEIAASRRLVRRRLLKLVIIVLACGAFIPIPPIRDAIRAKERFHEWAQSGAWLDQVISGESPVSSMSPLNDEASFLAEVHAISNHVQMIAERFPKTTDKYELSDLAALITDLVDQFPEERYLPLLDALAERKDERGIYTWAISTYGCYPFAVTGDRLLNYLHVDRPNLEIRMALAGLMRSWHESGDRQYDDEVRTALIALVDNAESAAVVSQALYLLAYHELLPMIELRERFDSLQSRISTEKDHWTYEDLERILEKASDEAGG